MEENYYLECDKWDLISKMAPLFPRYFCRDDYKIDYPRKPGYEGPWCFIRHSDRDCNLFHQMIFPYYGFIHSRCHTCWKIVIQPRTLKELFELYDILRILNFPSKCGIEGNRENSSKLYAGYIYNNSKNEGLERYKIIRTEVNEKISPDVSIILKKGCTEFEQELGDSANWEITEEQKEMEFIFAESIVGDVVTHQQTKHVISHIHKKWIHAAYQWGDETYLEYTGGNPLFREMRTYHNERPDDNKQE
jgi:hypothetical protein